MGPVYGNFTLRNACDHELAPKIVRALVDTGANIVRVPAALASELQLEEVEKRRLRAADREKEWVPYVGRCSFYLANATPLPAHWCSATRSS
jgi:hypothetical protein